MDECKNIGINTLGPDINESRIKFSVNHYGDIRFGMAAIKGVGEGVVQSILEERDKHGDFASIYDFVERINLSACNKKTMENLAVAGAFDCFDIKREAFLHTNERGETFIDILARYGAQYQLEKQTAANSLFGGFDAIEIAKPPVPENVPSWSDLERLNRERDLISIYISGHPLDQFKAVVEHVCNLPAKDLSDLEPYSGCDVAVGGIITSVKELFTQKGLKYGRIVIEDYSGSGEFVLFGERYAMFSGFLKENNSVMISGRVEAHRYRVGVFDFNISKIEFLPNVVERLQHIQIDMPLSTLDEVFVSNLSAITQENKGKCSLSFRIHEAKENKVVELRAKEVKVNINANLLDFLDFYEDVHYVIT